MLRMMRDDAADVLIRVDALAQQSAICLPLY
jgi:hypothetical protein